MIYKIIDKIEAYSLSVSKPVTAVEFGEATLPAPPYVVVKQEPDGGGRGTAFRIIVHFAAGQQKALKSFARLVIGTALDGFAAISSTGMYNKLNHDTNEMIGTIVATNDDQTISTERLYYMGDFL
jgi:hypothetical protein